MPIPRGGHAPGHIRDAFLDWVESAIQQRRLPDMVEVDGISRPARWLFGQLWNCSDALPGWAYDEIRDGFFGLTLNMKSSTFAAAARAFLAQMAE